MFFAHAPALVRSATVLGSKAKGIRLNLAKDLRAHKVLKTGYSILATVGTQFISTRDLLSDTMYISATD